MVAKVARQGEVAVVLGGVGGMVQADDTGMSGVAASD